MDPRVTLVTLGVTDLAASRRFYVDGLGWTPTLDVPDAVVFLQVGHGLLLALFPATDLDADAGDSVMSDPTRSAFSLAHNVGSEAEVDAAIADARAAGATVLKEPQRAAWGGYHAYFADPSGFRWEVAHNSGLRVEADGTVVLGPVDG